MNETAIASSYPPLPLVVRCVLTSKSIYRAFKFRLYPTKEQEVFFERSVGCARFVYNKLLELSIAEYQKTGKFILGWDLSTQIPELKKEFPWLTEVYSRNLVQSANDLATAFKNRFSKKAKRKLISQSSRNGAIAIHSGMIRGFQSKRIRSNFQKLVGSHVSIIGN
jgi:transposase